MKYTPHAFEELLPRLMDEFEEQFASAVGGPFAGLTIQPGKESGWLLVVKTRSAQRGPLVAFIGGVDVGACFHQLIYDMHHGDGIRWKLDNYVKRVDKA